MSREAEIVPPNPLLCCFLPKIGEFTEFVSTASLPLFSYLELTLYSLFLLLQPKRNTALVVYISPAFFLNSATIEKIFDP